MADAFNPEAIKVLSRAYGLAMYAGPRLSAN
jgi:hypothetical protein